MIGGGLSVAVVLALLVMDRTREAFDGPTDMVQRRQLVATVTERGELESSKNAEIVCRVKSATKGNSASTSIKWLVEDGTQVEKGTKLIELDSSGLKEQLKTQKMLVEQSQATWVQAKENLEIVRSQNESEIQTAVIAKKLAELDLKKYIEGEYIQLKKDIQGRTEIAKSDLETWLDRAAWSRRMLKKGYVSRSQAEADEARLNSARIELAKVAEEMRVLQKYTKIRTEVELRSKVEEAIRALDRAKSQAKSKEVQAEVDAKTKQSLYEQELAKQHEIEDQLKECTLYAPQDGLVIYYIPRQSRFRSGSSQTLIAPGEPVREGQKLMQIPDLSRMQVNVSVHEAMVSKVRDEERATQSTGFSKNLLATSLLNPSLEGRLISSAAFPKLKRDHYYDQDYPVIYPGNRAVIRIDARPNESFGGHVKWKANTASQTHWLTSDVKVYKTLVVIDDEVQNLNPGMSAEVTIFTDDTPVEALSVPVQSIVGNASMGKKRKCFVIGKDGQPVERDIVVGEHKNLKYIEVVAGLKEGEEVVLNPRPLLSEQSDMRPSSGPEGKGKRRFPGVGGKGKGKPAGAGPKKGPKQG